MTIYICTDRSDLLISTNNATKADQPGVIHIRVAGLHPNYGNSLVVAHALSEMLAGEGVFAEVIEVTDSKEQL